MNIYEKNISGSINKIANKEIYFNTDEILKEPDIISTAIIGELVSWACTPTNISPISIARNCLKQFPIDWVSSKIKKTALGVININDDWDYRRFLELSEIISSDLLKWAIKLNEKSNNTDILDTVNDFNERLQSNNK